MKSFKSYITESPELYHSSHSAAMNAADDHIRAHGYHISDSNWFHHVTQTRKPAEGETREFHIPLHQGGKETNKYAHIQVYNRGNRHTHPYELNSYIDSGKPKINESKDDICPSCDGSGEGMHDGTKCGRCGGSGKKQGNTKHKPRTTWRNSDEYEPDEYGRKE